MISEILATLMSGLFAGAAIYINLVEHPARLSCGIALAVTEWRPSYKRGAIMQASLAVVSFLFALTSWLLGRQTAWLLGGLFLFAVIPFTLIVILPTNKELESDSLDVSSARAGRLLRRWNALHAVRTGLALVAFIIFLCALQRKS
jgi:Domain of unknown function (DUF1772)